MRETINLLRIREILKFDKQGLLPAVIQDYKTNKVLMVAYMNKEALQKTITTNYTHFYSRKRKEIWQKGEVSGHTQQVKEIFVDCDNDCLLIKVKQIKAACHDGYRSCFYRKLQNGKLKIIAKKVFNEKEVYKKLDNKVRGREKKHATL